MARRIDTGFDWFSADNRYWLRSESTNNDVGAQFVFDNGDTVLAAGVHVDLLVPFDGIISGWTILSDVAGSATFDVWRAPAGATKPTAANSITGTAKPTMTADTYASANNLVVWQDTITTNDLLRVVIDSTDLKRVILVLHMRRPGVVATGAVKLDGLTDVAITGTPATGAILRHNGTAFVNVDGDATYAARVHGHIIGDVTGLQASLDDKATKAELAAIPDASVVQANLDTHTGNLNNPHSVTKSQIGLGNANDTSDAAKPISNATQTALNAKVSTATFNAQTLDAHADVSAPTPTSGHVLGWNGTVWAPRAQPVGLPSGGSTGQYLRKSSATEGAAAWTTFVTPSSVFLENRALTEINVPDGSTGTMLSGTLAGLVSGQNYLFQIHADVEGYGSGGMQGTFAFTARIGTGTTYRAVAKQFDQGVDSGKGIHWGKTFASEGTSMAVSLSYTCVSGIFSHRHVTLLVTATPA